jgi:ABC-type sugar transport system permease subunit
VTTLKHILLVLAVVIATALALFLRFRAVEQLPIDYDEDDYLRAAQQYAVAMQNGEYGALTQLNYRPEHPPLAKIIYGLSIVSLPAVPEIPDLATNSSPASSLPQPHLNRARYTAVFLNGVAVLITAFINPIAGLLLAVHTYTIKYSSQVMLESLPMLTSALAVWFYWKSKFKINAWLVGSAVFLGLTASAKYIYALIGIAILVDWVLITRRKDKNGHWTFLKQATIWGVISLITFYLSNPYLWPAPIERLVESVTFHGGYAQSQAVQNANFPLWQPFTWLFSSVPWHPGVFLISVDLLIAIFSIVGLRSLYNKRSVYFWWLILGFFFLLIWPTKWPQYLLVVMVPVCLSAAYGVQESIKFFHLPKLIRPKRDQIHLTFKDLGIALPWLLPGLVTLGLIAIYPLLYQLAMAMTDFSVGAIRDGLSGGVWREFWLGITGQIEPTSVRLLSFNPSRSVNYAGPDLIFDVLFSFEGANLLVFEIIWSTLTVGIQTALGVFVALTLNRKGIRWRNFWLVLFILPWAIPEFIGALMWMQLFDPRFGWFVLAQSNFTQRVTLPFLINPLIPGWQDNPTQALVYLIFPAIWYGFPFMMLAANAGLKYIPQEVNEASELDGATGWQKFRHVTWPLLLPLIIPAMIIRLIFAFNQFYIFLTFQTPYPVSTFSTTSYFYFADAGAYAFSAAINIVTLIFLFGGIFAFTRWTKASQGVAYA